MFRLSALPARPLVALSALAALVVSACAPGTEPGTDGERPDLAKAAAGPAVTSALPSYAHQGDGGLEVRILGSGFDQGSVASWERNGVTDPKVAVQSTRFLSSTELVATINVAPDATIDLYNVAVTTSSRKKGIGMEMFTVTAAQSIGTLGGNTLARAVNDQGAVVGYSMAGSSQHAFLARPGAAMRDLGSGQAYDLDADGTTVVGWIGGAAVVWRESAGWASSRLPDNGAGSRPTAITTTADGLLIGGSVNVPLGRRQSAGQAALWRPSGTGWILQLYPAPAGFAGAGIEDLNSNGQAVGTASGPYNQAYFWDATGVGTVLPSVPGDQSSFAYGIDPSGTIAAGQSGGRAVYWKRNTAGQWEVNVLESCGRAMDINGRGMIVGQGCENATVWVLNPGGSVSRTRLDGLGANSEAPEAEAINNAEFPQAAGRGKQQGSSSDEGVLWNLSVALGL